MRVLTPRPSLVGLPKPALAEALRETGLSSYRVSQVYRWLYVRGARDFDGMTDLSRRDRATLAERFSLARPCVSNARLSADGARKWLLRLADGGEVETVYIPETDRGTLCISSQIGCTLTCRFCHTGTQRLVRNLDAGEILGQIMHARDVFGEWSGRAVPLADRGRHVSNIVLMGMGEPLYNFDNVKAAMAVATDGDGLAISKRRITLSTAGVVPMMDRCGEEIGVNLAVSLHAVTDELRDELVPLNRKYPLKELMAACRRYPTASNVRRITFEYVMLAGVNDSPGEARALARLLAGIPAKVNLIPFNPWPGSPYTCSTPEVIERFVDILAAAGYTSPVRTPRGRDILAACGQLRSESRRPNARERREAEQTRDKAVLEDAR
ncbi:MAG: 23S rRNA (adenine(2503)-C(2))-methyltransferase RlmN [Alphaproteobacteria bacterium]|nr:23S rRNA (adenine(2503)-C(2))-methyltransferase RlmN [Alphaproteobacteria bacterium]